MTRPSPADKIAQLTAQVGTQADTIETLRRKNAALEAENRRQAVRLRGGPELPASGAEIGRNRQGKG